MLFGPKSIFIEFVHQLVPTDVAELGRQSSAKMVTDVGFKDACEEIKVDNSSIASYFSMQINVTDARGVARIGLCLPKECTSPQMMLTGL